MPLNHGDRKTVNRIAPTGRRFPLRFAPWPLTAGSGSSGMLSIGSRVQGQTRARSPDGRRSRCGKRHAQLTGRGQFFMPPDRGSMAPPLTYSLHSNMSRHIWPSEPPSDSRKICSSAPNARPLWRGARSRLLSRMGCGWRWPKAGRAQKVSVSCLPSARRPAAPCQDTTSPICRYSRRLRTWITLIA